MARRFGSPLRLREQSLDVKLLPWLDSIARDVRLGARMLRKNAVVTAAAVVSLSLALGACVAAFSLVDALILRPLPVRDPEQLIYLTFPTYSPERPEGDTFNDPLFVRLRDAARGHADLFAMSTQVMRPVRFDGAGEREGTGAHAVRVRRRVRSARRRAGGRPAAHRARTTSGLARIPVAVVSHAFWMRRFGGDPAIVGRWLALEDRQLRDRRRGRAAVHGRRAGPSDGSVAAVRDVQPAGVWELRLRLVPHRRARERRTSGSSRRRA